jgi:hypothetical protein
MERNNLHNIYSALDLPANSLPRAERVFISHRSFDKPLAAAIASLLESLSVHYWFDRDDEDLRRAAALGMAGDQRVVHAIDRGIRHSSRTIGLLSWDTRGSWWVPYEIGASRLSGGSVSFLVLSSIREMEALPEYVRLVANYWSVDELVRWAAGLRVGQGNPPPIHVPPDVIAQVQEFVPRDPPSPTVLELSSRALAAINRLSAPDTWEALALTPTEQFDWLPTNGGLVRELAYDLLAPLALFRLIEPTLADPERKLLKACYQSTTQHYDLARLPPALAYHPEEEGWRQRRYVSPASSWLQGLRREQLDERLDRFFVVQNLNDRTRLASREEFKANFDRILMASDENERRSLGVLLNPLFGFTPSQRPIYWRVLAVQQQIHQSIVTQTSQAIFDQVTTSAVAPFVARAVM